MECATAFVFGILIGAMAMAVVLLTGGEDDEDGDDE